MGRGHRGHRGFQFVEFSLFDLGLADLGIFYILKIIFYFFVFFWYETGHVLRPTVSDHITVIHAVAAETGRLATHEVYARCVNTITRNCIFTKLGL